MKVRHGLLALICLAVAACAGAPPPPPPARVVGDIQASATLNPAPNGQALPLRLRLYELRSPTAFQNRDFFSLWDKAQATLGVDLVGTEEYVVQPGATLHFERQLDGQTHQVGFIAAYRDINGAIWRQVVEIRPNTTQTLNVQLGAKALSVTASR
ncbi:type VI secretion system lipoprotein TssJ [Plasticicumulans acidivorans]|uniref:Type VI secretion system protein VasD n=1 Tax=Plasticicumulans acidivorans TaxID=886464 RepID=A0A317MYM7_9GAMM|nr:type VI secretion system lipoprotein TssJ [Plasticicumulans acidivorans]PWV64789.1 type VI secretion system protein VasD [Plasticicumulans acidivorans]